jgi:hypothetical protein
MNFFVKTKIKLLENISNERFLLENDGEKVFYKTFCGSYCIGP